jgi:signal transduction histidine kinase
MTPIDPERILVLAPTPGDAAITRAVLEEADLRCVLCADTADLCRAFREGAGAILMTEDVLLKNDTAALITELRAQPTWSDVPVLLLGGSHVGVALLGHGAQLGNLTILERPVRLTNLVSALKTAIRARRRQYQIREQLVALELAEERLRESDRRKDEFLAILAHELRNPLAPARNAAHFLRLREPDEADLRRAAEMIERQIGQMSRLIDDLLDVSRISRGLLELRRERVELREIVETAVDACRHEVDCRHHALRVSLPSRPLFLEADRERLVQVLCNLLTNAAKYTPAGGQVEVAARKVGDSVEISVRDNGIGIPAEKLSEIFELFAQVDRTFDRQGGLGIGLTLVRQIVELHGGSIEARSEGIGRGSVFTFRLPVTDEAPIVGTPGSDSRPMTAARRRILAADDNRDSAESLAVLLQMDGHEVRLAFDGEAAIALTHEFVPDVALLDIAMPKQNGFDVARHIRRQPWGSQVYLIALTGWGQEEDRARVRAAGFDAHLVKPVEPRVLSRILAETSRA